MARLHRVIQEKFLTKLSKSDKFTAEKLAQLRKLMEDGKKLKAEDLAKIFSTPDGGDVK